MTTNYTKKEWQVELSQLITDPGILWSYLELDSSLLTKAYQASSIFPLRVTRTYLSRIQKGNIMDPLLRQILPIGEELVKQPGYSADPLLEEQFNPVPGLLHKYHGRVLVMLTGTCAIHCRYCFRREFPYHENNPSKRGLDNILQYIANDTSITEIILSGGDPLTVNERFLQSFSDELVKLSHVKRLRIHSRIPIVLPQRITDDFLNWVHSLSLQTVMVIHANHPQEIDDNVLRALRRLRETGMVLLNQAVLLRGINDDVQTLIELNEILFRAGVLPYYLHLLDKVQGTSHFDLPYSRALQIHAELMQKLPGYLVPKLVCEEPNQASKILMGISDISIT